MNHSKVFNTMKIVLLLVGVLIVFLLVGRYYRNSFRQNSGNILSKDIIKEQESTENEINQKEEAGAYVIIRKEDTEKEANIDNSSLEFRLKEKDFTNSTEWVHIIEFE